MIKAAEKHGVKLLLTLADGRSHCGHSDGAKGGDGSGKRPDWYANGFRDQYLPHVTQMTSTYKDSPAIGMWEIINEPGDAEWQTIKLFFDEVAAEMKKNDPNHLVSTGSWAPWAYDGDANFQTLHESPNIDVGSVHEYDYDHENSNTIESPHFAGALRAMNNLNKVLIVGETAIESGGSCRTDRQARVSAMKQKFDLYLNKGAGAVLVWNLAQSSTGCGFTFPVTDPLLDMIKTYPLNLNATNPRTGGTQPAVVPTVPPISDDFGPLRVSDNMRYLVRSDGTPFFWMGDTAWSLFTGLTREDPVYYLQTRKNQSYNVIQAVAIFPQAGGSGNSHYDISP